MESRPKSMRSTLWRFLFLFFCSSTLIGYDFCYDNPAPLITQLKKDRNCNDQKGNPDHGMGLNNFEFNLLYSVYSFPNIILPLFGGYLIDKIGKRTGLILFTSFIAAGQFLFYLSTYIVCWADDASVGKIVMIISRAVFGLGGENLSITTSAFIGQWFKGKELAFALGIDISSARISATVNDAIQPVLYRISGNRLHLGYMVGFILAVYAVGCALVASFIDIAADKSEKRESLLSGEGQAEDQEESEEVRLSDMLRFSLPYWLITGSCVFFYMPYFSLLNVVSELMQKRFAISEVNAGFLMGIPYFMAAIASPITGILVDRIGKRPLVSTTFYFNKPVVCLSNFCMILGFTFFILIPQNNDIHSLYYIAAGPLILCGFAYCFYVSGLWPSIPYVVDKHLLGSAYGITTAIQNCGLALGPIIVALVVDTSKEGGNYRMVNAVQILESSIGLAFGILLWVYDSTRGGHVLAANSINASRRQEALKRQRALEAKKEETSE